MNPLDYKCIYRLKHPEGGYVDLCRFSSLVRTTITLYKRGDNPEVIAYKFGQQNGAFVIAYSVKGFILQGWVPSIPELPRKRCSFEVDGTEHKFTKNHSGRR